MSKPWTPYVVKQGDHLEKLAFLRGTSASEVWSHPQNKTLADKRKTGAMLHPGDVLYLPTAPARGLELSNGTSNRYQAEVPDVAVAVRLQLDPKGKRSSANQPFEVRGAGAKVVEGVTDGEGTAHFRVPVLVHEVEVHFTKLGMVMPVHVGGLDPIEEGSGVKQRLRALGFLRRSGEVNDEELVRAMRAFQRKSGLAETGLRDAESCNRLVDEYLS